MSRKVTTNFYTSKRAKELFPDEEKDRVHELAGIKQDGYVLVVGPSGTGKSNSICQFLQLTQGIYSYLFLFSRMKEKIYTILESFLPSDVFFHYTKISDFPSIEDFDSQVKAKKKVRSVCVFDDICLDKKASTEEKLESYYQAARKKHLVTFMLTQKYTEAFPFIRAQINTLILFQVKTKRELNQILNEQAAVGIDIDTLQNMYAYATKPQGVDELPFLLIDTHPKTPENKRYRRNWDEYLDPAMFARPSVRPPQIQPYRFAQESDSESESEDESPPHTKRFRKH